MSSHPERAADALATEVAELFRRCERRLGRYLAQVVADRTLAEGLLQDTFHDAFRARHRLNDMRNPDAWLFGIARNRALRALRGRRRFQNALRRLAQFSRDDPDADGELLHARDLLERHLSPEDRTLLVLRYLHGFRAEELAEMAGRSPAAVRQRLSRARSKLADAATRSLDT
jgi:RNA polymerase sigma-70 factor (ECF subfamily)